MRIRRTGAGKRTGGSSVVECAVIAEVLVFQISSARQTQNQKQLAQLKLAATDASTSSSILKTGEDIFRLIATKCTRVGSRGSCRSRFGIREGSKAAAEPPHSKGSARYMVKKFGCWRADRSMVRDFRKGGGGLWFLRLVG